MTPMIHHGAYRWGAAGTTRLAGLIGLVGVVIVSYLHTFETIVGHWRNDGYRHAYFIPLISLWLLWRVRDEVARQPWTGSASGLVMLAATIWLWLVARGVAVDAVEHLAALLMIVAVVWAVAGWATLRIVWFPLVFLVFALPLGGSVIPLLMESTADVATQGLSLIGTPAYREGMVLYLPHGSFEVAAACSGLNYLNAGLALGVLVGHLSFRSFLKQGLCAVAAAVILILMNGVRVLFTAAIANGTEMQVLAGRDHVYFGWVLFACAIALLCWIAHRYSDLDRA